MPLRKADSQSEFAIDAHGVARRFGARWVLRGVSLQVRPGEIVGLLGANGSGKSTLLRIFATLLKPSAGTALVHGHDLSRGTDQVRAQVGFLAHSPGLYDDLSARENLELRRRACAATSPHLTRKPAISPGGRTPCRATRQNHSSPTQ